MIGDLLYGANVEANGIRQHYLRYGGKGPSLVLVPGITSPAVTWGFVAERLGLHFDTYVLDVRGRGLSSTGPDLDYGLESCAADLLGFVEALDLSETIVVGHSMGARIAIRAAGKDAARISRLVLVDPPVSGPGRRAYPANLAWYTASIEAANRGMGVEAMRVFCPSWTEEQLRLRAEWLHTCYQPAIVRAYEGFHTDDIHADLPKLAMPCLLMVAGRGGVVLPEDEREISGLKPDIRINRVPQAGHMIPWDDFEGFFEGFGDFLGPALSQKA